MKRLLTILTAFALTLSLNQVYGEQNVDLSTIPPRDTVQLTIYNSEDLTLVRETRHITFKKGLNPLQFSWVNTLIDPTSVDLRFLTHQDELELYDTTFPHAKPQMLYWNVRSDFDGSATVEISYFTSGITWAADYVCISNPGETVMSFEGFVRITNNSGEDYTNAQMRLVVGTINLVERVRDLAQRGMISKSDFNDYRLGRKKASDMPASARRELAAGLAADMDRISSNEKQIIKEGLSEYFIYTIEGTETVKHAWSKRMRLFAGARTPFRIQYRSRPVEYGHQLVRMFLLRNDEESNLGSTPLPDGIVRLYRDNGRDGLSYLVQHYTKYVPIGQEIELNLGVDPEVIHERVRIQSWRDGFWFHDTNRRRYVSLDGRERIERNFPIAGWNAHDRWVERIRNYRDKPIEVEIRLSFNGHVEFASQLEPELYDFQSPQFSATIEAGRQEDLAYHVITHQGINAKQNNVTLREDD